MVMFSTAKTAKTVFIDDNNDDDKEDDKIAYSSVHWNKNIIVYSTKTKNYSR